jgi:HD-GYP domain-containing protein (c-di-GMP phosphodiesterase class II)
VIRVSDLDGLLKGLPDQAGRRVTAILTWMLSSLSLEGIALLVAADAPSESLRVRESHGSLAAMAPLLAVEWSRTGIPRQEGEISLLMSGDSVDRFYCLPLTPGTDGAVGVLVLQGNGIRESARARAGDLSLVTGRLRDALEQERIPRRGTSAAAEPIEPPVSSAFLPGLSLLTEDLRLPLYVCDATGQFRYASPAFLELTGHPSLEALCLRGDLFLDMKARANELAMVRSSGKVASFPLVILSGAGNRLEIRDSAVSLEDSILGVFFDVTALMSANAELKDTLQIQELLNDSIMAGSRTLQRTQGAAIRTLARLAEYRDQETGFHLQRICEYTRLLAMQVQEREPYAFRITREYGDDISLSSMLHDIGKVSIPDSVLLKPGKLDPQEWEIMKKHTYFGWEVLHKADKELGEQSFLTLAATIALSHHERYDGKGYPNGSAGEQIPLSARISAVADVYDALTSVRPYKPAWSHEQAMEEILRQGGGQFDPVLVEILRDINAQFAAVRRQFPE